MIQKAMHVNFGTQMLDKMMRLARESTKPMGGLQVILCGDFYQLPPVSAQRAIPALFNRDSTLLASSQPRLAQDPAFCFEAPLWNLLFGDRCYELYHVYRQQHDSKFVKILHEIRHGIFTSEAATVLNACVGKRLDSSDGILPTQIFIYR
jgi:ATP-dependent DNA helicase PIF1